MNESVQPSTNTLPATEPSLAQPSTLPITVDQYESLVARGDFEGFLGQVELIHGRIVHLNPLCLPEASLEVSALFLI